MIELGTTDIGKMYLGETEIAKAYLGESLVYDAGGSPTPPTPQVTYIANPSTAYINTGITMADTDKLVATFSHHTGNFITGKNASSGAEALFIYNNVVQWKNRPSGFTINDGNQHTIELSSGVCVVDGVTYTFTGGGISLTDAILVCKAQGDNRQSTCRIYAWDILDTNGNYRFKGRPAYQDNKYGLYDEVSGTFFSSASNVEFTGEQNT